MDSTPHISTIIQAVKKTLMSWCKCHGVSGSCQQRTCWKRTSTLQTIGEHLTGKFARAHLLESNESSVPRNSELVYIEQSPSFCQPLAHLRTPGVSGRLCNQRNATHTQVCQPGPTVYVLFRVIANDCAADGARRMRIRP